MKDDLILRTYQPGDEHQLLALHQKVMNTPWSEEFWRWLYVDNPAGEAVVVVAEDGGRIIGHFAYFPIRMQWKDRPFMGSKSVQAMVDPDYQGRGLFTRITKELLRYAHERDVALTYSCPNDKSYVPLVRKVGYRNISEQRETNSSNPSPRGIPLLVRPLSPSALASVRLRRIGNPILQGAASSAAKVAGWFIWPDRFDISSTVAVQEVSTIDDRFDALWQSVAKDYALCAIRDREFLDWRYTKNPERDYLILVAEEEGALLGYVVATTDELRGLKAGFVVDILARHNDHTACEALLKEACRRLKHMGADVVASAMLPQHFYYTTFKRCRFVTVPQRWAPKKFFMIVHDNGRSVPKEVLYDKSQWFVTFGDWDVF